MYYRWEIAFSTDVPVELETLQGVISKYLEGYTLSHAYGAWEGQPEDSYVVVFLSPTSLALRDHKLIHCLADAIKEAYDQKAVLVSRCEISVEFV